MPESTGFVQDTEPFRRELLALAELETRATVGKLALLP